MDSLTKTININLTPTVSFTATEPECAGTGVDFTNTGSTGSSWSYFWDLGQDAIPATAITENPVGVLYSSDGTKTISFTISDGNCTETFTNTITINETPLANFASTAPECTGLDVDFTNTGSTGGSWTYLWDFGSGATPATSTLENPTSIIYSTDGTKLVKLIVTDGTCTDSTIISIDINLTPTVNFASTAPVCAGTIVDFTNTGSTGSNWSYLWDLGQDAIPATATTENPVGVLYSSGGTKTISFTISDGNCTETFTNTITILETPLADFTFIASLCTYDTIDFQNTGTTGATYSWDFGSGATPATDVLENPTGIIYSTDGIKTVTLVTTIGTCTDTSIQTININETPAPNFTHNAPQCEGDTINFTYTGTTGPGWIYDWDFGTGAYPSGSTAENPTGVLYSAPGVKTITLTVTNGLCSETATQNFTINETPIADFTFISSSCTYDTVDFANMGTTGAIYSWNFGSGATPATNTIENPTGIIYSTDGIKIVTLITTLGTCTDTSIQTINITETPAPNFTHNAPQCEGDTINFTYTGTTGLDWIYEWDLGFGADPSIATTENPQGIYYYESGNKIITLTVTNGLCSETTTGIFNIYPLPIIDAGKDTTICADRSVQIGETPNSNFTYFWFPSNTLDSVNISNPTASPIAPVTNYILTVSDQNGCWSTDSVIITMLSPLNANAGIDLEICHFDEIQIGAALVEGQIYNWLPIAGLDDPTLPNPIASPDSTTEYTLSVSGSGCDSVTDEIVVLVHPLPNAYAGVDDTITNGSSLQLIATGGIQYFWYPPYGLDNTGIYHPIANPEETTVYIVEVTDIYGCMNSDTMMLSVIEPSFWVPNAFTPDDNGKNDIFYVRGDGISDFELKIFNRWSEIIFYSKDINTGWDGTKQGTGEKLQEGAYVYYIKGVRTDGVPVSANGMVNLIR